MCFCSLRMGLTSTVSEAKTRPHITDPLSKIHIAFALSEDTSHPASLIYSCLHSWQRLNDHGRIHEKVTFTQAICIRHLLLEGA